MYHINLIDQSKLLKNGTFNNQKKNLTFIPFKISIRLKIDFVHIGSFEIEYMVRYCWWQMIKGLASVNCNYRILNSDNLIQNIEFLRCQVYALLSTVKILCQWMHRKINLKPSTICFRTFRCVHKSRTVQYGTACENKRTRTHVTCYKERFGLYKSFL